MQSIRGSNAFGIEMANGGEDEFLGATSSKIQETEDQGQCGVRGGVLHGLLWIEE